MQMKCKTRLFEINTNYWNIHNKEIEKEEKLLMDMKKTEKNLIISANEAKSMWNDVKSISKKFNGKTHIFLYFR